MLVYCTNTPPTVVGSYAAVEVVLDSSNPNHSQMIASYVLAVEGDAGGVPVRARILKTETGFQVEAIQDYDYQQLKIYALERNKTYIDDKRKEGCMTSFGYPVSCQLQDIQNMAALVDVMVAAGISEVDFRDHLNDMHKMTVPQLRQTLLEVYQYGIAQYQVKWVRENQIKGSTSYEALMSLLVSWGIAPENY